MNKVIMRTTEQMVRRCPLLIACRLMWFRVADLISMSNITVTHCIVSADYHDDEDDDDDEEDESNYQDEAEEDADISSQDFELSESALSSQLSSSTQTQQLDAQDEPPEPFATTSGSATASEQQAAAANMSSSHQQDVGQSDSAQTSRVGEQGLMPVASQSATGDSGLDFEVASASQPAPQDADPGEQKKKKPLGRPKKTKPAAEPKPKTPGKPGRPKKSDSAATQQR